MREAAIIAATAAPRTRATLAADLRALGLRTGDVVLVHCALSTLGWVAGGAAAVIHALTDVLGEAARWSCPPSPATSRTPPAGATRPS
ncbi:MAG: AAC(3) family N-acetyltransferase, partial [Rhodospirillales bacterium]|nr:AAC(3) family N-acetyltransferase [Rhodospirillales bacterium]